MHFLVISICEDDKGKLENLSCAKHILHSPQAWSLVASVHSSSPFQEMLSKPAADPVLSLRPKVLLGAELTNTCVMRKASSISLCGNSLGQNRLKYICYLELFNFIWDCTSSSSQRSQTTKKVKGTTHHLWQWQRLAWQDERDLLPCFGHWYRVTVLRDIARASDESLGQGGWK